MTFKTLISSSLTTLSRLGSFPQLPGEAGGESHARFGNYAFGAAPRTRPTLLFYHVLGEIASIPRAYF